MLGLELVYFLAALAAIGAFLFAVRRASEKRQLKQGRPEPRELPPEPEAPPAEAEKTARAEAARAETPAIGAEAEPEVEPEAAPEVGAEADGERLRAGLARTRGGFVARLGRLFSKKQIGADLLDDIEEVLFSADIGPKTAERLFAAVKASLSREDLQDPQAVWEVLKRESARLLALDAPPVEPSAQKPFVLLTIGVNGVGKTTTIGKLAAKWKRAGHTVLLGAGDTFRAAAVEQLEIWADRAGASIVRGKEAADPSSVIFDAIRRGHDDGFDIVIADTAGRLHTRAELMDELKKVRRVAGKALEGAPHETWLVLDATTGQNAIQQAQMFKEAMDITGIVLTKLDGTAKGGVILGICDELRVPVRYIGIGESIDDLRPFDAAAFIEALYEDAPVERAA
jgi:fused signal recognition particle receptor